MNLNRLIQISKRKLEKLQFQEKRYLFQEIDWNQRLIVLLGHRGVGKSTLLLQRMKEVEATSIYLSLDDLYFEFNRIVDVIDAFYEAGIRNFFLDEVHRYPYWSKDLKNVYDVYDDIQLIVTGSSMLEIDKEQADLSRRAIVYPLAGLSFREFLYFDQKIRLEAISLNEIIENHQELTPQIMDQIQLNSFKKYLEHGYYPFFLESKILYGQRLLQTTNLLIETDIAGYEELNHTSVRTMKRLLYMVSQSVPFIPNIQRLAEKLEVSRNTVLKLLDLLDRAQVFSLLKTSTKGLNYLQKPEKIYLQNSNLMYALSENQTNIGSMRESYFFNQVSVKHEVTASKYSDFMVDNTYTFEIGGANKTSKQIQGVPNAFVAADNIEFGSKTHIPLYLFGFLY